MPHWWPAPKPLRTQGLRWRNSPTSCVPLAAVALTALTLLALTLTSALSGISLQCLGSLLRDTPVAAVARCGSSAHLRGLGILASDRSDAANSAPARDAGSAAATMAPPLTVLEAASHGEFLATMRLLGSASDVFVLFLGSNEAATGKSWCPDCRRADPIIMATFGEATRPVTLVRVAVGDRATWRSPGNPYRAPPLGVSSVPTLGRWDAGSGGLAPGALGDSEADRPDLVRALIG